MVWLWHGIETEGVSGSPERHRILLIPPPNPCVQCIQQCRFSLICFHLRRKVHIAQLDLAWLGLTELSTDNIAAETEQKTKLEPVKLLVIEANSKREALPPAMLKLTHAVSR